MPQGLHITFFVPIFYSLSVSAWTLNLSHMRSQLPFWKGHTAFVIRLLFTSHRGGGTTSNALGQVLKVWSSTQCLVFQLNEFFVSPKDRLTLCYTTSKATVTEVSIAKRDILSLSDHESKTPNYSICYSHKTKKHTNNKQNITSETRKYLTFLF